MTGDTRKEKNIMGRPLNNHFLGETATNQIQATVWGTKDSGATAGYLSGQNSPRRFKTTTVNGTSVTQLVNGAANLTVGTSYVNVFPIGGSGSSYPITNATGSATLMAIGNANVVIGGSGYTTNDFVIFSGGVFSQAANVKVVSIGANGVITALSTPINAGPGVQEYTQLPANISAIVTTTTGNGINAIVSSNFGIDTATVLTTGSGYTSADFIVEDYTARPAFTQPAVVGGAVTLGTVTVVNPGVVNVNPVVVIENAVAATTEYVKKISQNYVLTFQGNTYKWLPTGASVPSDYPEINVQLAYLDTLVQ